MELFVAWKEAGALAEIHIFQVGQHGFGMNKRGMPVDSWIERCYDWLIETGF